MPTLEPPHDGVEEEFQQHGNAERQEEMRAK